MKISKYMAIILLIVSFQSIRAQPGQIEIPRIEQMPALPSPLHIRDWKKVTVQYDSLVFNGDAQGEFLPLMFIGPGVNYPEHEHFGLYSYVGAKNPTAEAINVLPALVGATLNGLNKADQNGNNWVLMAEDFFNTRNGEKVYLNNFQGQSGNDWWYDTMPNVFFYQLFCLYPQIGHFKQQFSMVAERWLQAVKVMGGSATPWKIPNFYHRAWRLSDMTPNDDGVKEPEAAGAIGWLLYMAYLQTGQDKYRIGAEWSLEYVDAFTGNPFYELQLPYGVYVAARMNAELGTSYNIEKMLNWCFDPQGNVRGWGATMGRWGGYDCAGLIGEVSGDDYAFAMNTFEMLGAVIPMVRYDERFARTIARWALNAVNAARLFYANALPAQNQDSENWAWQYDPNAVISYEALREKAWYDTNAPFATGDAKRNGWAATNLALYGASHVGILGAIVDTTDVRGILKLNVRATDFFRTDSLPMFLFYNPYARDTSVSITVGEKEVNLYDLLTNDFIQEHVSGNAIVSIKADQAVLLSFVPAEATLNWQEEKLLADSQTVDFHARLFSGNHAPRMKALQAWPNVVASGQNAQIYCTAQDRDGDPLTFRWQAEAGSLSGEGRHVQWTAPGQEGLYRITCFVSDGQTQISRSVPVTVTNNNNPQIEEIRAEPSETVPGDSVHFYCQASDSDGDTLAYRWFIAGQDTFGYAARVVWVAPVKPGYYRVHCLVSDGKGGRSEDSVGITDGDLVLHLLLDGNAADSSPFANNGQVFGALPTSGFDGSAHTALHFNGQDDYVLIPNRPWLNFRKAITVAFWMRTDTFFTREAYPVSHGNWQNRWKISITNRHLRWTVKTTNGIYDLDSRQELMKNRFYFVTCTYKDGLMQIYLNANIDASKNCSGQISSTMYDLVLGQTLPGNRQYGFQGTLDNVLIFNRALDANEVSTLYASQTALEEHRRVALPTGVRLQQNYPNPFNPITVVRYYLPSRQTVRLEVFDIRGIRLQTLVNAQQKAGWHQVRWLSNTASGICFFRLLTDQGIWVKKGLKIK